MGHRATILWGTMLALLTAAPAMALPQVVTLGGDTTTDSDPTAACAALAASPFEKGRKGKGVADKAVYLDGAELACTAALAASPDSDQVKTWLGRVEMLLGHRDRATSLLEDAATASNSYGEYLLGTLLGRVDDSGDIPDADRSLQLLQQAATAGYAPAATDLGQHYEGANDEHSDYAQALKFYRQAAKLGDPAGLYKIGSFFMNGYGVNADFAQAMTNFQAAAKKGEVRGWYGIGQLYQFGDGVTLDYAKAAAAYQHGADAGEPMAETQLAYLYGSGQGVDKSDDKAFALLTDAANQDYGLGQSNLAINYLFGQGTAVDYAKAMALSLAAIDKKVTVANGIVGYMYAEGLGNDRNLNTAETYFQDGADAGDDYAKTRLETTRTELACEDAAGDPQELGANGHGVAFADLDADAAITACNAALQANGGSVGDGAWLARAYLKADRTADALPLIDAGVTAGNLLAMVLDADLLLRGDGVDQDTARGLKLYEDAAAQHYPSAEYALGRIYAEGKFVAQDNGTAIGWYRKAGGDGLDATQEIADLSGTAPSAVDLTGFGRKGPTY